MTISSCFIVHALDPFWSCAPVFYHSLSKYLPGKKLPGNSYQYNLEKFTQPTLHSRRQELCDNLFRKIISDKTHKLHNLLPPEHDPKYDFRHKRTFNVVRSKTIRYQKTLIPMMSSLFNNSYTF